MKKLVLGLSISLLPLLSHADSLIGRTMAMAGEHVKYVAIDKATDVAIDKAEDKAKEIAYSTTLNGTVIRVLDGDTLDLLTPDSKVSRIRLDSIDAPEKSQPYGTQATNMLSDWIVNQPVRIEVKSKDQYGRFIGVVFMESVNINRSMVEKGMAFAYTPNLRDTSMAAIEKQAHSQHLGLWAQSDIDIVKPWDNRHNSK